VVVSLVDFKLYKSFVNKIGRFIYKLISTLCKEKKTFFLFRGKTMEKQLIKWSMELCNQEGYGSPAEVLIAYNTELLGC
jgi:hypothetical protein